MDYRIDLNAGVVELFVPQAGSLEEIGKLFRRVFQDPGYHTPFGFLWNRIGLEAPSPRVVRDLVAELGNIIGLAGTKWAIVVDDAVNFGMMRMVEVLAEAHDIQVGVFTDEMEARVWLGAIP